MSNLIVGSILLACGMLNSRKEFLIEIRRDPNSGLSTSKTIATKHGQIGKLREGSSYGTYSPVALTKLLKSKLAKSFEITRVNGFPFVIGGLDVAVELVENGNDWNATCTAQPTRMIRPVEVHVTVNVGQAAPIW